MTDTPEGTLLVAAQGALSRHHQMIRVIGLALDRLDLLRRRLLSVDAEGPALQLTHAMARLAEAGSVLRMPQGNVSSFRTEMTNAIATFRDFIEKPFTKESKRAAERLRCALEDLNRRTIVAVENVSKCCVILEGMENAAAADSANGLRHSLTGRGSLALCRKHAGDGLAAAEEYLTMTSRRSTG